MTGTPDVLMTTSLYFCIGCPFSLGYNVPVKKSGIYSITHIASGKRYIGSAVNVAKRWRGHRLALRKGTHRNRFLQRAWNKYGQDGFLFSKLLICEIDHLILFEQRTMDILQPAYNISPTAGSQLGATHSLESRAKISAARSRHVYSDEARHNMSAAQIGHLVSVETRAKIAASLRGKPYTKERCAAMSAGHTAEVRSANSARQKGKTISAEQRAKISATLSGRKLAPEHVAKMNGRDHWTGRLHTTASKEKMSASAKARVPMSIDTRAKMSVAQTLRRLTERQSSYA